MVLEHLLEANPADFITVEKSTPASVLDAQYRTSILDGLDVPSDEEAYTKAQQRAARSAFLAITTSQTPQAQKDALAKLEVPAVVKELVGMLTAFDWDFVEQAKEMRGYAVAQLLEETKHPDARIRLKALELVGKVTEVALFTDRQEIKQVGLSDAELDEELKKRLDKYRQLEKEVEGEEVAVLENEVGVEDDNRD